MGGSRRWPVNRCVATASRRTRRACFRNTCIEDHSRGLEIVDGRIYYSDGRSQIRQLALPFPTFASTVFVLPADDGSEVYEFDSSGRHLRTLDGLTGAPRDRFHYDVDGRRITLTATTISPPSNG